MLDDRTEFTVSEEWREVPRETEVIAIGDLHGNYRAFVENLKAAGVFRETSDGELSYVPGKRHIVFHGDILADRHMDGFMILSAIAELRKCVEEDGGIVTAIAGNHEAFFIDFFLKKGKWQFEKDHKGLLELKRFASPETQSMTANDEYIWARLMNEKDLILRNMRSDPLGRAVLEQICSLKIAEVVDDTIFIHTNPTERMIAILASRDAREKVRELNQVFQGGLRDLLLEDCEPEDRFQELCSQFLNHDNRTSFQDVKGHEQSRDGFIKRLKDQGIHAIIHGHTLHEPFFEDGFLVASADRRAFIDADSERQRSIIKIQTDGIVTWGEANLPIRENFEW